LIACGFADDKEEDTAVSNNFPDEEAPSDDAEEEEEEEEDDESREAAIAFQGEDCGGVTEEGRDEGEAGREYVDEEDGGRCVVRLGNINLGRLGKSLVAVGGMSGTISTSSSPISITGTLEEEEAANGAEDRDAEGRRGILRLEVASEAGARSDMTEDCNLGASVPFDLGSLERT